MNADTDSEMDISAGPHASAGAVKRASWWRCFFAAFGACMLPVVLLWTGAALTIGVPFLLVGFIVFSVADTGSVLIELLLWMIFFPVPLFFLIFLMRIASGCPRSHLVDPVRARRRARLRGFQFGLCIGGLVLVFVILSRSSF